MERDTDVSPYDRMLWADGELEQALASGARRRDVMAYLGEQEYQLLAPLAQEAARAPRDPERLVHLIPGVMGSQLGLPRPPGQPTDLLWVDPQDVQRGRLRELDVRNTRLVSLGAVIYTYLALKLRLEAAGFTVCWFDYDWRRGIGELGALLAARLGARPVRRHLLVGHSLGGLVARAALGKAADQIERIVTLGTPHGGSYAALQALRGSYVSVRRVMQLDPLLTTEELTQEIFGHYPSLYQMLPAGDQLPDLRDAAQWPDSLPRPVEELLWQIGRPALPVPDAHLLCIAGSGFDTVCRVAREGDEFRYFIDRDGDGTVTRASATLAGHGAWYANTLHSELPRDARVADAVIELLSTGRSTRLPQTLPSIAAATRSITDTGLRRDCADKLNWSTMSAAEHRAYFESLNAPVAAGSYLTPRS